MFSQVCIKCHINTLNPGLQCAYIWNYIALNKYKQKKSREIMTVFGWKYHYYIFVLEATLEKITLRNMKHFELFPRAVHFTGQ